MHYENIQRPLSRAQNKIFLIMQGGVFLETFDLFLYIHLAPIVVDSYFSLSSENTLTMYLLTIFSVLFIRMLGIIIGGYIGDVYGRKPAMMISIVLTGLCCIGFAVVPNYETIGVMALMSLMVFRSLQSAASINEITCAITYMTEIIKRPYAFFITALIEVNGYLGCVFALFLASITMMIYSEGWKILFLLSGIFSFICFYFRRKVPESKFFEDEIRHLTTGSRRSAYFKMIKETLLSKLPLVQVGIEMGRVIIFYMVYIHCSVILKNIYGLTNTELITNNAIVAFVEWSIGLTLVFLTLKYSPLKIVRYKFFITVTLILFSFFWLNHINSAHEILLLQCVFAVFSLSISPAYSFVVLLYPIHCRISMRSFVYAASKLTYSAIGVFILFIGEYLTQNIAWSVLALISSFTFYRALQYLISKEKRQSRYKTSDYRKAMERACDWNLKVYHHPKKAAT